MCVHEYVYVPINSPNHFLLSTEQKSLFSLGSKLHFKFINLQKKSSYSLLQSQVGILVKCEDLFSDRQWKVCHAFATFVTQRTNTGQKVSAMTD